MAIITDKPAMTLRCVQKELWGDYTLQYLEWSKNTFTDEWTATWVDVPMVSYHQYREQNNPGNAIMPLGHVETTVKKMNDDGLIDEAYSLLGEQVKIRKHRRKLSEKGKGISDGFEG